MNQPTVQQALSAALALQQQGQFLQAEAIYREILSRQPNHAEALHLLGLSMSQRGEFDAGIQQMRRAIAANPSAAHFHSNIAQAYALSGRFDEAIAAAQQALAIKPDYPAAMVNLGSALDAAGRTDEAIAMFHRSLALRPESPEACGNLANALRKKGQAKDSIMWVRRALAMKPDHPTFLNSLGSALRLDGQLDEAITALRRAVAIHPTYAEAHNNLGNALREKGLPQEAIGEFEQALRLKPGISEVHNNLGGAMEELGRDQEAIEAYRRAIAMAPNYHTAHLNCGITLLRLGDFERGLPEYEWRLKEEELAEQMQSFARPRWDGSELNGRRIILHAEQGFGDTIQFVRYVPPVKQRGGHVILQCQPELVGLMRSLDGVDQIIAAGAPRPDYDVHCPLLSLPLLFGTRMETIPASVPYLRAEPELVSKWRQRLKGQGAWGKGQESPSDLAPRPSPHAPVVGLVWAGRPEQGNDHRRSMSLATLAPLATIPGVTFISLQKGKAAHQAKNPPVWMKLLDLSDELRDFSDSAAVMENLDLLISVDTAPVHLAGAIGRPVWALLSSVPDWRWHTTRQDCPWYPTMRLFRQPAAGDWQSVLSCVGEELSKSATRTSDH